MWLIPAARLLKVAELETSQIIDSLVGVSLHPWPELRRPSPCTSCPRLRVLPLAPFCFVKVENLPVGFQDRGAHRAQS